MGRVFGRYELLAKVATGGMAEVYLAAERDEAGGQRRVALKLLLRELAEEPEFVALFTDEARIASSLSHPNVCRTYELGFEHGRHYLAMEFVAGQSLARMLKRGARVGQPLPPLLGAYIIAEAAEGLADAHEQRDAEGQPLRIVHRDVSPQNLMVTYEGRVKVVDFGIAHAVHRKSRTRTGEVRGKVAYMSPEQVRGQPVDARTDVFALGVLLYEVATGAALFGGASDIQTMQLVLRGEVPSLPSSLAVPPELDAVIRAALVRQPEQRTPSARVLAQQLKALLAALPSPPTPESLAAYIQDIFPEEATRDPQQETGSTGIGDELLSGLFLATPAEGSDRQTVRSRGLNEKRGRRPGWRVIASVATTAGLALAGVAWWTLRPSAAPPTSAASDFQASPVATSPAPPAAEPPLPVRPSPTAASALPAASEAITDAAPPPAAVQPAVAALPPVRKPAVRLSGKQRSRTARATPAKLVEAPAPAPKGEGKLTFDSYPWTHVYMNGRKLGTTPLIEITLPAGRHRLRAVNEEEKIDRAIDVDIAANRTTSLPRQAW